MQNLPLSSFESSLGGLWRFRCGDMLDECELLVLPLMLPILIRLCGGWPPKWGRVRKGLPNKFGMPNCRNGAHGGTRDRGAKCAATAASWRAGCNPGGPPDMFDNRFGWPSTIILSKLIVKHFYTPQFYFTQKFEQTKKKLHKKLFRSAKFNSASAKTRTSSKIVF